MSVYNSEGRPMKLFELHHQLFEAERHYQALDEAEDIVNGMQLSCIRLGLMPYKVQ